MSVERGRVDLDAAVAAARLMISLEGESALTMRGLADHLGISPMAIYRHVADRDELIDLALDHALGDCVPPLEPGTDWRHQLVAYFRGFWEVMTREPGLGALAVTRPMQGPNMGRITNDLLRICRESGHERHAFAIIDALLLTTLGAVAYDISRPASARRGISVSASTPDLEQRQDAYGQRDPTEYFLQALETVIVGLQARLDQGDLPEH